MDVNAMKRHISTPLGEYDMDLASDLAIEDVNDAFINQPSLFAWWATLASMARTKANQMKMDMEKQEDFVKKTLKGQLDKEVRAQLELDGEKITEGKVENGIYCHPKYKEESDKYYKLRTLYLQADADASFLETAREAFCHRKEVLISLAANLRSEMNNSLDMTSKSTSNGSSVSRAPIKSHK